MKRHMIPKFACILGALLIVATAGDAQGPAPKLAAERPSATTSASSRVVLDQYCVVCHNQKTKTGGLALDTIDLDHVEKTPETWEKVVRKIRTGLMPPSGARRPERAVLDAFAAGVEERLDSAAALNPNPDRKSTRLNSSH